MVQDDERILKLALPVIVLLALLYFFAGTNATTGFVVYDTDYVVYDPLNPEHVEAFKALIDERMEDYWPYTADDHHYTFGCATPEGKVLVESLSVPLHGKQEIMDQATSRCVGRIYWRGAHR